MYLYIYIYEYIYVIMYVLLKPFWQFWNQASVWIKGICSSYFDSRVTRSKLTRPTFVCMHTKQPRALLGISSPPSGLSMFLEMLVLQISH